MPTSRRFRSTSPPSRMLDTRDAHEVRIHRPAMSPSLFRPFAIALQPSTKRRFVRKTVDRPSEMASAIAVSLHPPREEFEPASADERLSLSSQNKTTKLLTFFRADRLSVIRYLGSHECLHVDPFRTPLHRIAGAIPRLHLLVWPCESSASGRSRPAELLRCDPTNRPSHGHRARTTRLDSTYASPSAKHRSLSTPRANPPAARPIGPYLSGGGGLLRRPRCVSAPKRELLCSAPNVHLCVRWTPQLEQRSARLRVGGSAESVSTSRTVTI